MLAHARITWLLAGTLLAGCTPTPSEVSTGFETDDAGSTGDASTGVPPTSEGSATVASADTGTGTGDGTSTGEPTTGGSSEGTVGSSEGDSSTGEPAQCHPILAEVLYDAQGGNDNRQWVKLYNPCDAEIELADAYVLGYGGDSYTHGQFVLDGSLDPGTCRVVGGPDSSNENGNPEWDQDVDFSPDLQVSENPAGGVALFVGTVDDVMADTVPVDAVIYGENNDNGLIDANGNTPAPHVGGTDMGQSIRRTSLEAEWEVAAILTPNVCPAL